MRISIRYWLAVLTLALAAAAGAGCQHSMSVVDSELVLERSQFAGMKFRPTHFAILGGYEIIVEWADGRLLYRPEGSNDPWQLSPIDLRQPHSIVLGSNGSFYVSDTAHHRIARFKDLDRDEVATRAAIAGQVLYKPHDIAFDPASGFMYVIDGRYCLYRFRDFGVDESLLQFDKRELGYARALSVVKGTVYVVGSSKGQVVRIDDFVRGRYTILTSPGKKRRAASGSWSTTGLILNDIEYFNGYWYGTNFFTGKAESGNAGMLSLMRWKSWRHFKKGRWDDLSHLVEDRIVPYYLFAHGDLLYVACLLGKVYTVAELDVETRQDHLPTG